jgi:hypothetical protein
VKAIKVGCILFFSK